MDLDDVIIKIQDDLMIFSNPFSYENDEYYIKIEAKAEYAKEILDLLNRIKRSE